MTGDLQLTQVVNHLSSKGIQISNNNEWLTGCVNWYISNNAQANISEIQNFVYEQWLLADLREIGERCIPTGISEIQKTVLTGKYALQVDSFIDIGQSCYSQLQKIRNISTKNLEVSETVTQSWEPRCNRMLKLTCTDGVLTLYGMEYKPIPVLRDPLVPGLKVIIIGPVECRQSVVLLTSQNIEVLGGETDSLVIPNAVENVLARALNLEENTNPYGNTSIVADVCSNDTADNASRISNVQPQIITNQNNVPADNNLIDSDDDLMLCDQVEQIEHGYSEESNLDNQTSITLSVEPVVEISPTNINIEIRSRSERIDNPVVGIACPIVPPQNFISKRQAISPAEDKKKLPKTSANCLHNLGNNGECISRSLQKDSQSNILFKDSGIFTGTADSSVDENSIFRISKMSDVMSQSQTYYVPRIVYFQAYVFQLTSKPRIHNNLWKLSAIISDDSANLEVSFSNKFLEKIFGRTASQMVSDKNIINEDPVQKERVFQMLKNGKKKIATLKGQMKVQFLINNETPQVLEII